jgi:hypothetical protein
VHSDGGGEGPGVQNCLPIILSGNKRWELQDPNTTAKLVRKKDKRKVGNPEKQPKGREQRKIRRVGEEPRSVRQGIEEYYAE